MFKLQECLKTFGRDPCCLNFTIGECLLVIKLQQDLKTFGNGFVVLIDAHSYYGARAPLVAKGEATNMPFVALYRVYTKGLTCKDSHFQLLYQVKGKAAKFCTYLQ